jgi:hypothetical protein
MELDVLRDIGFVDWKESFERIGDDPYQACWNDHYRYFLAVTYGDGKAYMYRCIAPWSPTQSPRGLSERPSVYNEVLLRCRWEAFEALRMRVAECGA